MYDTHETSTKLRVKPELKSHGPELIVPWLDKCGHVPSSKSWKRNTNGTERGLYVVSYEDAWVELGIDQFDCL